MLRIGILASGNGTITEKIVQNCEYNPILRGHAKVVGVIASSCFAPILENELIQGRLGYFYCTSVDSEDSTGDPRAFGEDILSVFQAWGVNFVVQDGWLCKTPQNVI